MKPRHRRLPVNYETTMRLERAVYYNAARLFIDACVLYEARAYPSSYALAILAMEEVGKVQMLDHVCFETVLNDSSNRLTKDRMEHLFSRTMFYSHRNKQAWSIFGTYKSKGAPLVERLVSEQGTLDRHKQHALYVDFENGRIKEPLRFRATHAYRQLRYVLAAFEHIEELPFYRVFEEPTPSIKRHVKYVVRTMRNHFGALRRPKRKTTKAVI